MGNKPWQITREAIAEAEAAEDVGNADTIGGGDSGGSDDYASGPSEWEFDESTEAAFGDGREDGEDAPPPTPILDAYERSRDPVEMERLIQMAFDSLPERAGPQRYNHKRREHQRYKTIRVSCVRRVRSVEVCIVFQNDRIWYDMWYNMRKKNMIRILYVTRGASPRRADARRRLHACP